MTRLHIIFETKPSIALGITSICPLCNSHRILVGSDNRTVKICDVNLVINQATTMDIQDDTDIREVITVLLSRKMMTTILWQPLDIKSNSYTRG